MFIQEGRSPPAMLDVLLVDILSGVMIEKRLYCEQKMPLYSSQPDPQYTFWTTIFSSELVEKHSADIRKLGIVLHLIRWLLPLLYYVRIRWILAAFCFGNNFGDEMVYPLVALFLDIEDDGSLKNMLTCGMLHRVFAGAEEGLWHEDPEAVLFASTDSILVSNV